MSYFTVVLSHSRKQWAAVMIQRLVRRLAPHINSPSLVMETVQGQEPCTLVIPPTILITGVLLASPSLMDLGPLRPACGGGHSA